MEDVYYRMTEFAEALELNKCEEINSSKWPDLDFFHVTVAKNGGPIAMLIQDNVLFIGMKEIKSVIFLFSSFGKKLGVINVSIQFLIKLDVSCLRNLTSPGRS